MTSSSIEDTRSCSSFECSSVSVSTVASHGGTRGRQSSKNKHNAWPWEGCAQEEDAWNGLIEASTGSGERRLSRTNNNSTESAIRALEAAIIGTAKPSPSHESGKRSSSTARKSSFERDIERILKSHEKGQDRI